MPTKALCPRCGNALVVTAEGTLRQHGSCGKIPVEKAAGTVEIAKPKAKASKTTAAKRTTPAKKAVGRSVKKASARRK